MDRADGRLAVLHNHFAGWRMGKIFRKGAVGAMMDEYERASSELKALVSRLSDPEFEAIRDTKTLEPDCRSIQTVMNHVVRSGYSYADYLRKQFSMASARPEVPVETRGNTLDQFAAMIAYTIQTLEGRWLMTEKEISDVSIQSRWDVVYDMEQLLEHGIVHILRHRRQIERFLTDPEFASPAAL